MPKTKTVEHRSALYERYGSFFTKELYQLKGHDFFLVRDIKAEGKIKCLKHLTERTRFQYISDLCTEMQHRKILARNGRTFYFVQKKKEKK